MDNVTQQEVATSWLTKIEAANKHFKKWDTRFKCKQLEEYYYGFHWADEASENYTFNLFYATIETKLPTLLFAQPTFMFEPTARELAQDANAAFQSCSNMEDVTNELLSADTSSFADEIEAAVLDSFFRFGIVEIGYSTDWIDNPNAGKPILRSDYTSSGNVSSEKNTIRQPERLPVNEGLFFKYIPAVNFRVSSIDSRYLHRANWVGYFEFVRLEDLRANPLLEKIDAQGLTGYSSGDYFPNQLDNDRDRAIQQGDYVLIWKIWDLRSKKKYIISQNHNKILRTEKFQFLPFASLRFSRLRTTWYPLPPTFNWVSPQNELNDAREANRNHRKRFKRVYQCTDTGIEDDELNKLLYGPDGSVIKVSRDNAITPIANADLGSSANIALQVSSDDFNVVSATSSETRGEANQTTATQATITNQRAQVRENTERARVASFYLEVARLALRTIKAKFVNPIPVVSQSYNENTLATERTSREVNPILDLGAADFKYKCKMSVNSVSPVTNEEEFQKFLKFITLLTQYPQFAMSPILIRELAARCGYKNEAVILEFQKQAQLAVLGQLDQGMTNAGMQQGPQGNEAQTRAAQMAPPNLEQLRNQLKVN